MFAKTIKVGLVGTALLATAALAQTPTATSDRANMAPAATPATDSSSYQGNWRTSKVVGLNVYNDNNESLGSINDLLMDRNGNIKAVVIGVGGFLGVGEHLVAVPLDKIKFVDQPVAYAAGAGAPKTASTNTPPSSTLPPNSTTTGAANTAPATKSNPWYPDHAVFSATKDQLKAMPEFKYST